MRCKRRKDNRPQKSTIRWWCYKPQPVDRLNKQKSRCKENLIPQTKSRILIPDHNIGDCSDKDVVNKSYVDSRAFGMNLSCGLDMKGPNWSINLGDATNRRNKQTVCWYKDKQVLANWWFKSNHWWFEHECKDWSQRALIVWESSCS